MKKSHKIALAIYVALVVALTIYSYIIYGTPSI